MKSIRCWGPIVCIFACSPLQSLQHNAFLTAARLRVNCLSTRISRQIDTSVWRSAGESNGTNTLISSWVIVSAVNRWESRVDDTIMWREACGHQLKPVVERGKPWGEHVGFDIQNPAAFHWSRCCFTLIWPQSCTSFRLTDVKIFRRNKTCFVSFKEQGFCLQKRLWIMMHCRAECLHAVSPSLFCRWSRHGGHEFRHRQHWYDIRDQHGEKHTPHLGLKLK